MRKEQLSLTTTVCLLLFVSLNCFADDLPPAPTPNVPTTVKATMTPLSRRVAARSTAFQRSFALLTAFSIGATVADMALTNRCVSAGTCVEANPLFGSRPSAARLYGTSMPLLTGETLLSYYLKKHHPESKVWLVGPITTLIAHGAGIASNVSH